MKKNKTPPIENFTLDLTDAILPVNWPSDAPLILNLQTGQHQQHYDIIPSDMPWYKSLVKFVNRNPKIPKDNTLPIGVSALQMHVGAVIYDKYQNIVAQGKNKEVYFKEVEQTQKNLEKLLNPLRKKFPSIKDNFLQDFNETQDSLLNTYRPFENATMIYDVFCDIYYSGGGSTYEDGSTSSIGAYRSLIDFNTLKATLDLFDKNELELMVQASEKNAYLTPIHSVINGQIKSKINEHISKPKIR